METTPFSFEFDAIAFGKKKKKKEEKREKELSPWHDAIRSKERGPRKI